MELKKKELHSFMCGFVFSASFEFSPGILWKKYCIDLVWNDEQLNFCIYSRGILEFIVKIWAMISI
jgi:hypothetical protein